MNPTKKILSIVLKTIIGMGCLLIVYLKLSDQFTPTNIALLQSSAFSFKGIICFFICIVLIPVNWGLESLKWQLITAPVEKISFKRANTSVYSGICVGNFAPGRATEFLGKILYFSDENKTKITILHFINGMIQLSITIVFGLIALFFKIRDFTAEFAWITQTVLIISILLLVLFLLAILNINTLLNYSIRLLSKRKQIEPFTYNFPPSLIIQLFFLTMLRYFVFSFQFALLIFLFHSSSQFMSWLPGIALYFLITSVLPMISFIEAAIRTAIALVVFKGSGISIPVLALTSVLLWLINIIVPSMIGYLALLRMKFDFKFIRIKT